MKRSEQIEQELRTWPGVSVHPHRFGGIEFRLGKRELGHLHGDRLLDIPFPMKVRNELVTAGVVEPHHILPDSGWISYYLHDDASIPEAIGLLRRSYDLAQRQKTH